MSRRWQWGPKLSAVYDTAFHNIALLKKDDQLSVFTNGLWLFSEPDRFSAEYGVHPALLQHPNPKSILLLGGGVAGLLDELFKQPGISSVDYVEPDPDFVRILRPHLSPTIQASVLDDRVRLFHQDPRIFIRRTEARYDVVLMNIGDPITAQMNRFYTIEFFTLLRQRLSTGGVFSFAVSGGESMLGPTQARFLGTIQRTLRQVFPETLVYPGDQLRFFAAERAGVLLSDSAALAKRMRERNLQLTYIREEILQDALSPWPLEYLRTILEGVTGTAVNKDFSPICYFHNLMMWANQWHAGLQKLLHNLAAVKFRWLLSILAIAGGMVVVFFWTGRSRFRLAIAGSIFVSGTVEMVLQVVFLLGFQILAGFVYRQLALIIAFFMAGLAAGAGWTAHRHRVQPDFEVARQQFIRIQALMCILPVTIMLFFLSMHGELQALSSPAATGWLFSGISFITGTLGGVHFALAVMVMTAAGTAVEKIGGGFYALDLAGAAAGVLLAALFVLPVYGIINTLVALSLLSGISLLTLLRRP
jgi:spermidine synthase